ncbi:MAG: radical SAM protein [Dehalococcoidia bacterium]|nr:radical SAM protein [Dehalococcoidia bacterium]
MSRIDDLQKRYPTIPRDIIVKWEIGVRGLRDSEALARLGTWQRNLATYQSYDRGLSLKGMAQTHPERVREGALLRPPGFMITRGGESMRIDMDLTSPYEVIEEASGRYALYEGDDRAEAVYFIPPEAKAKELLTRNGTPVTSLVTNLMYTNNQCFMISPVRFCEYFTTGDDCKFCNYNASQEDARSAGLHRPVKANLEETAEAYRLMAAEVPQIIEGQIQTGGFADSEQESNVYLRFVEKIASSTSYLPNLTLRTQPMTRDMMQRLKDAGTACVSFNLEVWDPEIFAEVCPGKAKHRGRERYLEAFQEAVEVFGRGSVGCDLLGGVTLQAKNGHKTWQEARDSHIEGNEWLIRHGVLPVCLPLRLGAGSVYGDDPSSRGRLAPTEYYLDMALAHHRTMMETGMYQKLNKLLYCPIDCIRGYCAELGMHALAGGRGNWAALAGFPDEGNWIKRFVESQK